MCGRFVGNFSTQALLDEILAAVPDIRVGLEPGAPDKVANFNTAPTQAVPILIRQSDDLVVRTARWGLLPVWSKDPAAASKMINARSETVLEKPAFRNLVRRNRCLVPASGYYEWSTELGPYKSKQPFYISNEDSSLLPMAGIFEEWVNPISGELVTSTANEIERTPTAARRAFIKSGVGVAGLKLLKVCKTSKSQDSRSSLAACTASPLASGSSGN